MIPLRSICLLFSALIILWIDGAGQTATSRAASISGRVTLGGEPLSRVTITIHRQMTAPPSGQGEDGDWMSVVRTDSEGRYSITGLAPGRYNIQAGGMKYVSEGSPRMRSPMGEQTFSLGEGEARTGFDFRLVRGGAITGVVTDPNGKPVIERSVYLLSAEETPQAEHMQFMGRQFLTDDRGVYRIYGVRPGRYLVSAGGEEMSGNLGRINYSRTFAPGTTEKGQATIIEIKAGEEIADVNIRMAESKKAYDVIGKIVEEDTGKPVGRLMIFCMKTSEEGDGAFGGETQADEQGNFQLRGLSPGTYQAQAMNIEGIFTGESNHYYVEPTKFEVSAEDMTNVVIKAKRGVSVSGVVVLDAGVDPALKPRLQQMFLTAEIHSRNQTEAEMGMDDPGSFTRISADGSFQFNGVRPGTMRVAAQGAQGMAVGSQLQISRIEHNGAVVTEGVEVSGQEAVKNLRIIFAKGTCVIRGQVRIIGGEPPPGLRMSVNTVRAAQPAPSNLPSAEVDDKGRFVIENLLPGEYILFLSPRIEMTDGGQPPRGVPTVQQKVTVTAGAELPVVITLDLSKKTQEDRQ